MNLTIENLLRGYRAQAITPLEIMTQVLAAIDAAAPRNIWISRIPSEQVLQQASRLADRDPAALPLYGVPFAIKDNIDLRGIPTTAGCPAFSYVPESSATVVQRLMDAGAIPIGKTNLDQFATGLVGTRSPYGECRNSFDASYISGGSSSGSAVAVATGLVSFALGTDTAGSGRIPAGFNNILGLKPSCGSLSTHGVVPACRSLDCVSIFALTSADALRVFDVAKGFDERDEFSRCETGASAIAMRAETSLRVGVPRVDQLSFFGDDDYAALYRETIETARALGWQTIEIDFQPFLDAARLLYEGPWIAERFLALGHLLREQREAIHPITRAIVGRGAVLTAADAFAAQYRLKALQRETESVWREIDVLMTPTAGTLYTIDQVREEPIALNTNLGMYTNFVNLLDLAAMAVPAGFRRDGLPFGVTLVAQRGSEAMLLRHADRLHRARVVRLGATSYTLEDAPVLEFEVPKDYINVVVCGAHMQGLPLNHQLQERAAIFVRSTRTAPKYRFYALPGGPPKRPGLIRVAENGGPIDVEVWAVPPQYFGTFVAGIPAPLGIGKIELEDGSLQSGFLCESIALSGAEDITALGSWRTYLAR